MERNWLQSPRSEGGFLMLTLKLALRNMLAHGQRSFIMFLAVGLTSCFVFLFMAFSDGELRNFREVVMAAYNPPKDIVVSAKGYWAANDSGDDWETVSAHSLSDWPALLPRLQAVPGVADASAASATLWLDMQAGGQRYQNFGLRLLDPAHGWQILPFVGLKDGAWLTDGEEPQLMLHNKARASLPVRPGDRVTLTGRDLFGQVISQEVTITGFFVPGQDNPNLSGRGYLNRAAWELVSGFNRGEALEVHLKLASGARPAEVVARLQQWAKDEDLALEFTDATAWKRNDGGVYEMLRFIFQFISLLIVFVVSFGVMSVVSTNLYDRKREIGTYYCLGSEKWFLIRLYTAEILMINLGATLAGIGLGLGLREIVNALGIRTEDSGLQLVFGGSQFTLGLSADSVLFILAMMLTVTLVTALSTLGRRLKVSPVAALRETV
jgi:ABC-type lipoprotein release transport system permease subunit